MYDGDINFQEKDNKVSYTEIEKVPLTKNSFNFYQIDLNNLQNLKMQGSS